MLCDIAAGQKLFDVFKKSYLEKYPDFKGIIRWSAYDYGVAEIIDENHNLRAFRFARL